LLLFTFFQIFAVHQIRSAPPHKFPPFFHLKPSNVFEKNLGALLNGY
jgi:hypothetical protein